MGLCGVALCEGPGGGRGGHGHVWSAGARDALRGASLRIKLCRSHALVHGVQGGVTITILRVLGFAVYSLCAL